MLGDWVPTEGAPNRLGVPEAAVVAVEPNSPPAVEVEVAGVPPPKSKPAAGVAAPNSVPVAGVDVVVDDENKVPETHWI